MVKKNINLIILILAFIYTNCNIRTTHSMRNFFKHTDLPIYILQYNNNLSLILSLKKKPQHTLVTYCLEDKNNCEQNKDLWKEAQNKPTNNIVVLTNAIEYKDNITVGVIAQNPQSSDIIKRYIQITKKLNTNDDINFNPQCSTIKGRIYKHTVSISEPLSIGSENIYYGKRDLKRDWYNLEKLYPIITSTTSSSQFVIGWQDKNAKIHLNTYKYNLNPINKEIVIPSQRLRDIYIDNNGKISIVHFHSSRMHVTNFDNNAQQQWNTTFNIREKSIPMHMGKITKYNNNYAVYFGIQGMGGHQGDALQFLDPQTGNILQNKLSWTWGCSHSIDERLKVYQNTIIPICLSDYYPSALAHRINPRYGSKVIVPEVRHYNGIGSGNIGGMIIYKNHAVIAMSSSYLRSSRDAALIAFSLNSPYKSKGRLWLTDTPANEIKVKIANYGSKILLMWTTTQNPKMFIMKIIDIIFNDSGFTINVIKEEENIVFEIGEIEDLATTPNKNVISAARVPNEPNKIQIQLIKKCDE